MVVCSKAPVGSCCTEDRTGHPAWKWSNSNVYTGASCQDARMAFCKDKGTFGSKYCPGASTRPVAQKPQCGKPFANRGFTCCCGGMPGCGPSGYTFTKDRADCCAKFGRGGGKCFNDTPARPPFKPITSAIRPTSGTLPPTAAMPRKATISSRFPGGPRPVPSVSQQRKQYTLSSRFKGGYTDTNPVVHQFPNGERPASKPPGAAHKGSLTSRFNNRTDITDYNPTIDSFPSGDGAGGAPPTNTPGDEAPSGAGGDAGGVNPNDFITQLCPYFQWVPVGGKDCNMHVVIGAAAVLLGGALLVKLLKGR